MNEREGNYIAKGDDSRVRTAIDQETNRTNTAGNALSSKFNNQYDTALSQNNQTYDTVYNNLAGFKPQYNGQDYLNQVGLGSGGGGGISDGGAGGSAYNIARGIDPGLISGMGAEAYAGYRDLSKGLQQNFWNDYNNYASSLNNAISGYQNFANTGGYSQGDLDAISAAALAPSRAVYQQGIDQARLAQNRAGGNLASVPASISQMTRNQNQAISDASIANQANMAQLVQQGKLAGLSGLSSTTTAGMNARTQVEALDAQMKANGLGGMTDIEKSRLTAQLQNQQLIQSGDIAAAQLAESAANRSASASAASAAQQLAQAQFLAGLDVTGNNQYLQAQQGLTDLYGTTPGATALADQSLLSLYGLQNGQNQNLIQDRIVGSGLPGKFQSAMGNIGTGLNMVGSVANMF